MQQLLIVHNFLMDVFDKIAGYIEDYCDTGKVGWVISFIAELIFFLYCFYFCVEGVISHHYISIFLNGFVIYLSGHALQNLIEQKGFMLTSAFKQAMRSDPSYGLSKVFVVCFVAIMILFSSGGLVDDFIMFADQILYLSGFYIMIANPIPPYKKSFSFSA